MGCGSSHVSQTDLFNLKLTREIQAYHKQRMEQKRKMARRNSLQAMCLAFPRVRKGFEKLRQGYCSLEDKKTNGIEFEVLKKAEIFAGMEEELLLSYINESDVDENKVIDFREYVLTLTFIFFLHPDMREKYNQTLVAAFQIVSSSWCAFDSTGYGWISRKKAMAIINGESSKTTYGTIFTEERFNEMDWDRNGEVSFKEFFLAFLEWSGVEQEKDNE